MRFTDVVYKNNDFELCEAVTILSVKMGSLDIDFPIHVYGTVIARDSLDKKCVYLFRRGREDPQTINSKVCNSVNPHTPGLASNLLSSWYTSPFIVMSLYDVRFEVSRQLSKCQITAQWSKWLFQNEMYYRHCFLFFVCVCRCLLCTQFHQTCGLITLIVLPLRGLQ